MVPAPVTTPMTTYAEYMQSRGMPSAPIVAPSSVASFENDMSRGAAAPSASIAVEPITPKPGAASARIPWGSDLAICEFVVDGVKRRYRIVQ